MVMHSLTVLPFLLTRPPWKVLISLSGSGESKLPIVGAAVEETVQLPPENSVIEIFVPAVLALLHC
jgi:hypothetical protein